VTQQIVLTEDANCGTQGISEPHVLRVATTAERRGRDEQQRSATGVNCPDERVGHVLETSMKVNYDAKTDILTVIFRDVPVAESDEQKPGVILDYDAAGNIVSIEVLDASRRVDEPGKVTMTLDAVWKKMESLGIGERDVKQAVRWARKRG
jgi:YD repeat-containing protein